MAREVNPFTKAVFSLTDEYRNRVKEARKAKPVPFMQEKVTMKDFVKRYEQQGSPVAKKNFIASLNEKDKRKLIDRMGVDKILGDADEPRGFGGGEQSWRT